MLFKKFIFTVLSILYGFSIYAAPLAVYLTWQHDPATTMTIQWVTSLEEEDDTLTYKPAKSGSWVLVKATHTKMPEGEPYLIHRTELCGLKPNSDYLFRTPDGEKRYKFRTMPNDPKEEIRFVAGGDMYHDTLEALAETNRAAVATNPHFALLGGDIAYTCDGSTIKKTPNKERWIEWLSVWSETMVTSEGRLIPFIPAIGNHDVNGGHGQSPAQAAFFHTLFPMPGEQGYNVLDFGKYMSILILDSGHTRPVEGAQREWLYEAMKKRKDVPNKFAIYHVPAYPCYRNYKDEYHTEVRKHWVPIFEEFGLTAAFENHDHAYKRTKLIYQDQEDIERGVLYLGDGAWGVVKPRKPRKLTKLWYLAATAQKRHFILVSLQGKVRVYTAIDHTGQPLDLYIQR